MLKQVFPSSTGVPGLYALRRKLGIFLLGNQVLGVKDGCGYGVLFVFQAKGEPREDLRF